MNYFDYFMENYVLDVYEEIEEFLENKEDVYKENYYLRDNLQIPYVSKELAKPKVRDEIIEFVGRFLDEHSYQLSTSGPVHTFTFSDKEVSVLYKLFNVNGEMLYSLYENMIEETYYGKISKFITGWVKHAPHKILLMAILTEAAQKGYDDIIECCEYMWIFTEYPIIYREYWKTGVKEEVMNYTIEHLGSKFKIIVHGLKNLQQLLKYDAHSAVSSFIEKIKSNGSDNLYIDLMYRMRNQINSTFRNLAREYYNNDENNSSQHNKDSKFDDGSLADQEGHTTNISQTVENTVSKFMINGINNAMAKITADRYQVDKNNLITFINQIWSSKNNKMNKLIEDIITSYFNKNPTNTSVGSSDFVNFGLLLYRSIGTSKDPIYQEIKSIMSYWMFDIIDIKQFYQREGTHIAYTRAIFDYVILMINYYN